MMPGEVVRSDNSVVENLPEISDVGSRSMPPIERI